MTTTGNGGADSASRTRKRCLSLRSSAVMEPPAQVRLITIITKVFGQRLFVWLFLTNHQSIHKVQNLVSRDYSKGIRASAHTRARAHTHTHTHTQHITHTHITHRMHTHTHKTHTCIHTRTHARTQHTHARTHTTHTHNTHTHPHTHKHTHTLTVSFHGVLRCAQENCPQCEYVQYRSSLAVSLPVPCKTLTTRTAETTKAAAQGQAADNMKDVVDDYSSVEAGNSVHCFTMVSASRWSRVLSEFSPLRALSRPARSA